ncbi:PH domain-containing protein [Deinococcus sp. MIMF12]|uniref:PH domain-containing protein n=1 Tax=Deinococcus rhizophilus TaxID=3049544 RepID=A0ABT7JGY6_9DEIO|nr:PH domain-containing protein [Deinococcus rhizophilus]MDL2343223.1 PH domain-containing protein [Deinococcus rhizophilus]
MPLPLHLFLTLLATVLAVFFLIAPRRLRYALTSEGLQVSRLSSTVIWPYAGLRASAPSGRLGLKVGGTGMAGYYTGNYQWRGEGPKHVQAVASRLDRGVLIDHDGRTYFLTPADPAGFLQQLRQRGAGVMD